MTPEVAKEMRRLQRMIDGIIFSSSFLNLINDFFFSFYSTGLGNDPDIQKLDQAKKKNKKKELPIQRAKAVAKPTVLIVAPTRFLFFLFLLLLIIVLNFM